MPTTKELIDTLMQDPINLDALKNPVLASDLGIYEEATYNEMRAHSARSPLSREPLIAEPFPIKMDDFRAFCVRPNLRTLRPIAICPITNLMMTNPAKVHLLHTNRSSGEKTHFAFVCDRSALQALPQNIKVVKAVDWDDLKTLLSNQQEPLKQYKKAQDIDLLSLEDEAAAGRADSEIPLAEKWEIALVTLESSYTKTQKKEPTATPYRGAFFQEEPGRRGGATAARQRPDAPPQDPAPSSGG
jgi:hypothetical protein